jgi:hypothetical protein
LAHCTPTRSRCPISRRAAVAVLIALAAAAWTAPAARADGDPASDVLAVQSIFLPKDANIPLTEQAQLANLVQEADRRGFALRVAIIASTTDLGSVTALWRQPESYARFLGQELALVDRGTLLVVMPNGYGTQVLAGSAEAKPPDLTGLAPPGASLGTASIAAVRRLAAQAGHPLTATATSVATGSEQMPVVAWLVFAVGCVLIALAWMASVRARPLTRAPARRPRPS